MTHPPRAATDAPNAVAQREKRAPATRILSEAVCHKNLEHKMKKQQSRDTVRDSRIRVWRWALRCSRAAFFLLCGRAEGSLRKGGGDGRGCEWAGRRCDKTARGWRENAESPPLFALLGKQISTAGLGLPLRCRRSSSPAEPCALLMAGGIISASGRI